MPEYKSLDSNTPEGKRTAQNLIRLRFELDNAIPARTVDSTLLLATSVGIAVDPAAAGFVTWAAAKLGRPVKWTGDRSEAFLTDAHGRDHVSKAELALDQDHKILGLRVKTHANFGAYMSLFSSSVPTYLYATLLSGQYDIPAISAEVIGVYTNTTPVDAYRGAGRPEASYLVERLMETAARQLKVDSAALRKKNFITQFPHQTPVIMAYDTGDFHASLDAAMTAIDYAGFAARKAKAKEKETAKN